MRTICFYCFPFWLLLFPCTSVHAQLVLTGIIDGPLAQGEPKAVELYVSRSITDLSIYGLRSATNGAGPGATPEYTFPAVSVSEGNYLYVARDEDDFFSFFGFYPDFEDNLVGSQACNFNGNDAIELFRNDTVIDVYGEVSVDGLGQSWEYTDSWVYRRVGQGPSGDSFTLSEWEHAGIDALDGVSSNATSAQPFPFSTYAAVMGLSWEALKIEAYASGVKISWQLAEIPVGSALVLESRTAYRDWTTIAQQRLSPLQRQGYLLDSRPQAAKLSYRLRLISSEGDHFLSSQLSWQQKQSWWLSQQENELYVLGNLEAKVPLSYKLLDMTGRRLVSGQTSLGVVLPWYPGLASGYYRLSCSTNAETKSFSFFKP